MTYRITKSEVSRRMGYFFLGLFSVYLIDPARVWIEKTFSLNPVAIGIGGILLVLFIFKFD